MLTSLMRIHFLLAIFAVLAAYVAAWSKEDYEIFDLVSAVEASEGPGTTFYSWLDLPPTATVAEITKAYRRLSVQIHPDKNPNVKGVQERFARLGVVATILRNPEGRERYDFFYKNGLPKWRGTGYYYSRFRPGLGSVLVFLTIVTSTLQYVVQGINHKRDLGRIDRIMREARSAAWGPKMIPLTGRRKVRVNLAHGEEGEAKRLDMVVDNQTVYILDPDGTLHALDRSAATPAAISRTWFFSLVSGMMDRMLARSKHVVTEVTPTAAPIVREERKWVDGNEEYEESSSGSAPESSVREMKAGRTAAVKTGGKRRGGRR